MKNWRTILILVIVLGALAGVYFAAKNVKESNNKRKDVEQIKVTDFEKSDITEIKISNKDGDFIYKLFEIKEKVQEKDDKGKIKEKTVTKKVWKAVEPEGMQIDSGSVDSIAWNVANISSAKKINIDERHNLKDFGLDKPIALTVILKDGNSVSLELGSKTPTGDGYYIRKKEENAVYVIDAYKGGKLEARKFNIIPKSLYKKEKIEYKDFNKISMIRDGNYVFKANRKSDTEWTIIWPITANANMSSLTLVMDGLKSLRVSEFIEENPNDLVRYGLDSPRYVFEYNIENQNYKLMLGNVVSEDQPSYAYAMMSEKNIVFTVSTSKLSFLDKSVKEIIEPFAYIADIKDVSELKVSIDGRTDVSVINYQVGEKDQEDIEEFTINGIKIEGEDNISLFKKYYQAVIGVTVDKILPSASPKGEPEIIFEYTLKKEPWFMKIEFIPTEDGYSYYVMRNGKYAGITVRKRKFNKEDGLRPAYNKLMEALKKSSSDESAK